jgi:hypothetical protein
MGKARSSEMNKGDGIEVCRGRRGNKSVMTKKEDEIE